jgi:hypothetical protein
MDRTLAQARKEANSWTLAGLLSAGAGLSVWALNPASWVVWLCSGAFVMVGFYLVKSSRPFLAAVEQLLQTDQPCQMDLSIRGQGQFIDRNYCAELRFPQNSHSPSWDIRLFVSYQPWLDVVSNPLPAKVWGASRSSGPVVIETVHGSLLPSGPGAVSRRPSPQFSSPLTAINPKT